MRARIQFAAAFAQLEEAMLNIGRASACLIIGVVLAACAAWVNIAGAVGRLAGSLCRDEAFARSLGRRERHAGDPDPSVESSAAAAPTAFTSTTYGYSLTLPAGWTAIQATKAWDGTGAPFHDVPEADQFVGPGPRAPGSSGRRRRRTWRAG